MPRQNWITAYSRIDVRPIRYKRPEDEWLELQGSLNRWGKGLSVERLQRLGWISRIDE